MNRSGVEIDRAPWQEVSIGDWYDWKWQFKNRVRTLGQLALVLKRSVTSLVPLFGAVIRVYPFAITPYYLSLLDRFDESDPLRLQCFPDPRELRVSPGCVEDPLAEEGSMPVPGLIHRYPDRCLVIATCVCAVHCRHCNRKRMWREKLPQGKRERLRTMVDYIARTPAIREVILSGGDPLMLSDAILDWLMGSLRAIPHVEVLRIGSRAPVTLPMRVTPEFCTMLKRHRPLWFNTQFNHAREITGESAAACERLLTAGIPVSNQSVLLKGVNDNYETMRDLLYGLARISVRPYYLFQMDPVIGGDHFRSEICTGTAIMEKLRRNISGRCLPRYVQDCPDSRGKIPLQSSAFLPPEDGGDKYFDKRRQMD